ncbi:MAG: helix-turn-helix transcriptional regulator [Bacilli bacterium]|nr:helix-turn-helix transcriptional regulator [Bacilli bacterium]
MQIDWAFEIKAYREKVFITQEELAAKLGVSFATVNRWENKRNEPSIKQKRAISNLLNLTGR